MLYGFDIGGTKIAFAVYDQALNCLFSAQIATPDDYAAFVNVISERVFQADAQFNCQGKVGLGFPGVINCEDKTIHCVNVVAIKSQALIDDLGCLLQRDIKIENDANCFLLSECIGGSAEGTTTVLGITLGTGVGGAIYANGSIVNGQNGLAGEIGHYPLPATVLKKHPELPFFNCGCGRQLCLESYVSGTGLSNLYQYYFQDRLTAEKIAEKFHLNDKKAQQVVALYVDILAAGIGTAMLVLDADVIVFGGGLAQFETILEKFIKELPKHLLNNVKLPLVVKAKFGVEGGMRGAALLNYKDV